MTSILLSAVVVAHNEEYHLDDCLKSLGFADELVVVLDKCTDKSKEIALRHTKKIVEGSWDIEGARRNAALSNCNGKWIIELDADERISHQLRDEILENINDDKNQNLAAKIDNHIGNRSINNGWLRVIAVSHRQFVHLNGNKKYYEDRSLHPEAKLDGQIKMLKNPITHYMDHNLSDLISRFNKYTDLRARDLLKSRKRLVRKNIITDLVSFINLFFKAFILKKGYKEGKIGLLIAILCASYKITSYSKAIELQNNKHDQKQ